MRRDALPMLVAVALLAAGCSRLERLSIVKPTAERGGWTQVAPEYEVSDKGRRATPVGGLQQLAAAREAYHAGKLEIAAQQARAALKAEPTLADGHALLGAIAAQQGDSAAAGRHYQQAAQTAPGVGAHANNYGAWLCANGRAAEALGWFSQALADTAYPAPASVLANAGTCAQRAGEAVLAETYWRQALTLNPNELNSLAGMADLQFALGRYLDARAFVERWLALAPRDPAGLQLASQIELKLGDTAASARYLHTLQSLPTVPRTQ